MLLHRDVTPKIREQQSKIQRGEFVDMEVRVAKSRDGSTGTRHLKFAPKYALLKDGEA